MYSVHEMYSVQSLHKYTGLLPFLAPLTIVRRSLSDPNLSVGVRQLFQIATSPTFFN